MELNLKEFLMICGILIILGGMSYFFLILDNQEQLIKIQGYVIKHQGDDIKEKENILEQERILDEDKDGDGLSLRQEKKLRTFDTMIDSDSDGISDKYDEHPAGGGRMIVKYLDWYYANKHWTLELSIPSDVITYYEQVPRPRWRGDYSYFSEFIDFNDKGIEKLTYELKSLIDQYGDEYDWDYYDKIMFVMGMVRQIHYASDILVGFDQFTKFPMQTLNDGTGDCEDIAILAAAILKEMDYDVKLVFLDIPDGENHVAIAVFGEEYTGVYFEKDDKKYYYIETIMSGYGFGEFPSLWSGGNVILIDII